MPQCLLGLGSNQATNSGQTPQEILDQALSELSRSWGVVGRVSRRLETRPIGGPPNQPRFLNAAALFETAASPRETLEQLQAVETRLGRKRTTRWGPRTLDLDLLLYDDQQISTESLTVPHPRLAFRRFVLAPAAEIAPDWMHPTTGATLAQLLSRLTPPWHIAMVGEQSAWVARAAAAALGGIAWTIPTERVARSPERKWEPWWKTWLDEWAGGRSRHVFSAFTPESWPEFARVPSPDGLPSSLTAPQLVLSLESDASRRRAVVPQWFESPPRTYPVLRLPAAPLDAVVSEATAAAQAMEFLPT